MNYDWRNGKKGIVKQEIIEAWSSLKEKIITLLSDLDPAKSNQEAVIEHYEKKMKEKNKEMTKLEEEYKDLSDLVAKVRNKQFLIVLLYEVLKIKRSGK